MHVYWVELGLLTVKRISEQNCCPSRISRSVLWLETTREYLPISSAFLFAGKPERSTLKLSLFFMNSSPLFITPSLFQSSSQATMLRVCLPVVWWILARWVVLHKLVLHTYSWHLTGASQTTISCIGLLVLLWVRVSIRAAAPSSTWAWKTPCPSCCRIIAIFLFHLLFRLTHDPFIFIYFISIYIYIFFKFCSLRFSSNFPPFPALRPPWCHQERSTIVWLTCLLAKWRESHLPVSSIVVCSLLVHFYLRSGHATPPPIGCFSCPSQHTDLLASASLFRRCAHM